ncbi:MAG: hypoxanthine phosphoribosyltransferase [Acidobacteria bacterium]|nr:hypoxanthine phosphoribosyltransferase [Acidobacteriota bacterium]
MKPADEILASEEEIQKAITKLAETINQDYREKEPIIIAVLNGAYIFSADLTRQLNIKHTLGFAGVKSTTGDKTGKVRECNFFVDDDFTGRDILLLDDIFDSGETLSFLVHELLEKGAREVKTCILVRKIHDRPRETMNIDYLGFEMPDKWLIGYGMDYNGRYRTLKYITYLE